MTGTQTPHVLHKTEQACDKTLNAILWETLMAFTCALRIGSIVMCVWIHVCRFGIPFRPSLNKFWYRILFCHFGLGTRNEFSRQHSSKGILHRERLVGTSALRCHRVQAKVLRQIWIRPGSGGRGETSWHFCTALSLRPGAGPSSDLDMAWILLT